jgi:hypothetical protein
VGPPEDDTTMALAAQGDPARVPRLLRRNAETPVVDLSTLSQAGAGEQSDPTIEDLGPTPLRAALPKPFQAVAPKPFQAALPKAPVTEVPEKTGAGTTGVDEGNGLVRNSPNFSPKPDPILPVVSQSGAGAGGWNLFQGIKDAVAGLTGGGGSLTGAANATDGGAEKGGGTG